MATELVLANLRNVLNLVGAFYWIVVTAILLPGVCLAYYLLPLSLIRLVNHDLFLKLEHKLCRMVNDHWAAALYFLGFKVTEYGEDIRSISETRSLVTVNHLGIFDHFVVMAALADKGSIVEKYLWIIFHIWKWTPLGVAWMLHGNFFVNGGPNTRARNLFHLQNHLSRQYWKHNHGWIIMYPEGTRLFLIKETSQRYAAKHGLPHVQNVALPRVGAFKAVMDVCAPRKDRPNDDGEPLEYIVDITLGFPGGQVPALGSVLNRTWPKSLCNAAVCYRIFDAREVPQESDAEVTRWLTERWVEKDKMLDHFYKTGAFPGPAHQPAPHFSMSRILLTELFWMISMQLHMRLWIKPLLWLVIRQFW